MSIETLECPSGKRNHTTWINCGWEVLRVLNTHESVDYNLLNQVKDIPWDWASSIDRCNQVIELVQWANYSTIVAMCRQLEHENESYWEDGRDRCFTWIQEAIYTHLTWLWYQVLFSKTQHYMTDAGKQRIEIPQRYSEQ